MLEVRNLTVRYGEFTAVRELSFTVEAGDWLMLIGPNGAGKSTAVRAVAQSVPYEGQILLQGRNARSMDARERARSVGVLSQRNSAEYAYTVEEIVRLGRYAHEKGFFFHRDEEGSRKVEEALETAGLTGIRQASVLRLSGGETQRVFLAQVFAQDPRLLILDEPANHLDLKYQKSVFELIRAWLRQGDRAVISVVHDLSLARKYGTRALLMHGGRCAAQGDAETVFDPALLRQVYGLDVYAWMRELSEAWMEKKEDCKTGSGRV